MEAMEQDAISKLTRKDAEMLEFMKAYVSKIPLEWQASKLKNPELATKVEKFLNPICGDSGQCGDVHIFPPGMLWGDPATTDNNFRIHIFPLSQCGPFSVGEVYSLYIPTQGNPSLLLKDHWFSGVYKSMKGVNYDKAYDEAFECVCRNIYLTPERRDYLLEDAKRKSRSDLISLLNARHK